MRQGIGSTDKILLNESEELFIISKTLGEIKTADIIEDPVCKERINSIGRNLLLKLIKYPKPENLMNLSKKIC